MSRDKRRLSKPHLTYSTAVVAVHPSDESGAEGAPATKPGSTGADMKRR